MACLTGNQIVEFFSPERSDAIAAEVDSHAARCEHCRHLLAEYAQLGVNTSPTHLNGSLAVLPSLTPTVGDSTHEHHGRLELVQRLAQAQARKYVGLVVKDKWVIEDLIGTGGMAHVFAARHRNGRRVAIKCMRPELVLERTFVERFLREGYVANKIEHPGAVAILDDDVMEDGTPFLVMELLEGRTLRQRLASGPMPLGDALQAIAQVLNLLAAAHDKGIVHRDLKPDNLFETTSGAVKVLDFGIARLKERTRPDFETRSGMTMGTVGYMPPEQARGLANQVDARSDVWAIGATLYSLVSGRRIHEEAATTNEALLLTMTSPVPPMNTLLPSLPRSVKQLLDTSLAFEKERRFASARTMKEALDVAMRSVDNAVLAAPPTPIRAMSPSPAAAAAAAAAATATATTVLDQDGAQRAAAVSASTRAPRGRRWIGWALGASGVSIAAAAVMLDTRSPATATQASSGAAPTVTSLAIPSAAEPPRAVDTPASVSSTATTSIPSATIDASAPTTSLPAPKPAAPTPPRPAVKPKAPTPAGSRPEPTPAPVDTRDPLGPQH